jgi:nucleoside recognition membrane protein YjiH
MRAVMLGYWVILVGIVLDVIGSVWDAIDDIVGEKPLGGLLTPELLKFLGIVVAILGLFLGFRSGLTRRG